MCVMSVINLNIEKSPKQKIRVMMRKYAFRVKTKRKELKSHSYACETRIRDMDCIL